MIHFMLKCDCGNKFDAWFKNGQDFEDQKEQGLLVCPFCNGRKISKAPMSPNLGKKSFKSEEKDDAETKASLEKLVAEIKDNIKKICEDVGNDFAEEARKIHYGEVDQKAIYGEATVEETKELQEEGINVIALPFPIKTDS